MRRHVAIDPEDQSLRIERDAIPSPAPGELLIAVTAAGINRGDLLQRAGRYPPPEDASPIMGLEVSGHVSAVGEGVSDWAPGDPVCALTHGGGYADHALAPASQCLPVPRGMSVEDAAALPEALFTVWHNLFQRAGLRAGERALVHGGASGIGTIAIQAAHALGAQVYTTAGTDAKCAALQALGATRAINYRSEDFEQVLTELGLRERIEVIFDMVGGDFIQKNFNLAAAEARIVYISFIRGFKAEVNFAPLLFKRLTMTGSTLRAQSFEQKRVMAGEIRTHLYPHLDSGAIRPLIDRVFPLEAVAEAHAHMQSGEHTGKILLRM
ncbi:NAD(P)H-quinone oxidoreductase [Mangrovimicrobium sediminis]|uniref:NAD(P)H-quinone oxidoreductase n=1 Tax=Mangrovimicrobium sediminis TaxID=2562682 RepID=UPI0019818B88|nr:NAD(P)H-quinone oxidoreductase [Haliea sp. SAOS-164]